MQEREHAGSLLWLKKEAQTSEHAGKLQMAGGPTTSLHTDEVRHNMLTWCYPGGWGVALHDSHTSSATSVSLLGLLHKKAGTFKFCDSMEKFCSP